MATMVYGARDGAVGVGQVLSRALATVREAPALLFGAGFLLSALPSMLLQLPRIGTGAAEASSLPLSAFPMTMGLVFYVVAQAVLLRGAVSQLDRRGEPLGALVAAAARSLLPLAGLLLLYWFCFVLGLTLLVVPGVLLALIWSVAPVALVVERCSVFEALQRSRYLTSGARWRIFGLFALIAAVYVCVGALTVVVNVAVLGGAVDAPGSVASVLVAGLLQTLVMPVWCAIQGALYVELRDRKDGPAGDRLADIFA